MPPTSTLEIHDGPDFCSHSRHLFFQPVELVFDRGFVSLDPVLHRPQDVEQLDPPGESFEARGVAVPLALAIGAVGLPASAKRK